MTPKRIQRKRRKGWRLPPNTICVTRPGPWGNPFIVQTDAQAEVGCSAESAVRLYRQWLLLIPGLRQTIRRDLGGKNLACWCKPGTPCHADVLLEIANRGPDPQS
jgi:hypothetical protein